MARDRKTPRRESPGRRRAPGAASKPAQSVPDWAAPVLVAILLCAPRLTLGYFWDDYWFLTSKGTGNPLTYLLPNSGVTFYRPIPQGVYFLVLRFLDPQSGLLGHVINLAALCVAIALLVRLVTQLAGRWAGLLAGILFATQGAVPSMVAWISGSHDLFAILFLLAALSLRHAGRNAAALAAFACALLSKESAIAFLPALVLWDRLVGRPPALRRHAIAYSLLAIVWMAFHPGVRTLVARGLQSGATGYLGFDHPESRWGHAARYLATLLNLPITGLHTPWPSDLAVWGAAACAVAIGGLAIARGGRGGPRAGAEPIPPGRLTALGALILIPSLLLPTLLIRHWAPYFVCMSAVGGSMLLAGALRRAPAVAAMVAVCAYLALGVWCRGLVVPAESVWSEPVFVKGSRAIRQVERNFRALHPTMPKGAQVLVSVAESGSLGINSTLVEGQALSVWYRDPGLSASRPERRRAGFPQDFLFRVTRELDVVEIDPDQGLYRGTATTVDPLDVGRPASTYARGLAASGEPDRAIRILERLAEVDQQYLKSYDLRLGAMVAMNAGREAEADSMLASAEPLQHAAALDLMAKVFGDPTGSAELDSCAYRAFGVAPEDPESLRYLMTLFRDMGYIPQAKHFAGRLARILPGDKESAEVLRIQEIR